MQFRNYGKLHGLVKNFTLHSLSAPHKQGNLELKDNHAHVMPSPAKYNQRVFYNVMLVQGSTLEKRNWRPDKCLGKMLVIDFFCYLGLWGSKSFPSSNNRYVLVISIDKFLDFYFGSRVACSHNIIKRCAFIHMDP